MEERQWNDEEKTQQNSEEKERHNDDVKERQIEERPDNKQIRKVFSRIAIGFSIMLILAPELAALIMYLISDFIPNATQNMNALIVVSGLSLYLVGIITYLILNKWVPDRKLGTLGTAPKEWQSDPSDSMTKGGQWGTSDFKTEAWQPDPSDSTPAPWKPGTSDSTPAPWQPGPSDSTPAPWQPGPSDSAPAPWQPGPSDSIPAPWQPGPSDNTPVAWQPGARLTPFIMGKLVLICLAVGFILNLLTMGINYGINLISHFRDVREITREYLETGYGVIPDPPYFMEIDPLMEMIGGMSPAISFLFVVVFTSFFEELLFRKLLYDKLIVFGGKVFILVSSLLFALFHVNHHQLIYAFGIGLVFAGVMYYTKKVSYCIILHMFFNFFGTMAINIETMPPAIETLYMYLYFILLVVGIVLLVRWLSFARKNVKFEPAMMQVGKVRNVFLNPGMITFMILTISTMILMV